jgi:acetyl esterase/lipase
MKTRLLILGFLISFSVSIFSQIKKENKEVFAYKSVDGHEIKANIFLPDTNGLHPVLVYFHGGGFIFGNRDKGLHNQLKEEFLKENYAVISADYRLAPETKLNEILKDVQDLIKWLRKNGLQEFNIDTNKIAVVGGSAGGYLALSTGFKKEFAPDVIIAISTPTGFSSTNIEMGDLSVLEKSNSYDIVKNTPVSYGVYTSRMNLWRFLAKNRLANYEVFGFDPATEPDKLQQFTLTNNIKESYPPTLIVRPFYRFTTS